MEATSLGFRAYVGFTGIMEKKMEATSLGFRVYVGFIGIMEKRKLKLLV